MGSVSSLGKQHSQQSRRDRGGTYCLTAAALKTRAAFVKTLDTWQQAMHLVEEIYKATAHFPREEMYGPYEPTA